MVALETCEQCGADFTRSRSSARFCSRRCQRIALARQDRAARALWRAASHLILGYANTGPEIDFDAPGARLGKRTLSVSLEELSAHQRPPHRASNGAAR
jgi:hypothetical protein